MTVKDLVNICRDNCTILFRNEEGFNICSTEIGSEGVKPYLNREILQWLVFSKENRERADICFYLKDEEEE